MKKQLLIVLLTLGLCASAFAQQQDTTKGNKEMRKERKMEKKADKGKDAKAEKKDRAADRKDDKDK